MQILGHNTGNVKDGKLFSPYWIFSFPFSFSVKDTVNIIIHYNTLSLFLALETNHFK